MIYDQHYDRSDHCDQQTVEIQPGDARDSEETREISPDDRSHDSQNDVQDEAFASFIHDLASNKSRYQSQYDPGEKMSISWCHSFWADPVYSVVPTVAAADSLAAHITFSPVCR